MDDELPGAEAVLTPPAHGGPIRAGVRVTPLVISPGRYLENCRLGDCKCCCSKIKRKKRKKRVFFITFPFILEVDSGIWRSGSSLEEFALQLTPLT